MSDNTKKAVKMLATYTGGSSIRRVKATDYAMLDKWYAKRGKDMPDPLSYSDMGFIVDGRVAGWLYVTNSNMAFIEGIISDPDTIPSYRRQSLKKLCGFLVDTATMLGYTNIFGISAHPSVKDVAGQLGFKEAQGYSVLFLSQDEEDQEMNDIDDIEDDA